MNSPDLSTAVWRKSSRSDNNGGACVEVAFLGHAVAVRDSKNPDGGAILLKCSQWRTFIAGFRADTAAGRNR
ncbi:DUF397 domain-containing protein [Plantactinospora sp. GCM10030261]|uniref:DUF397 domain-containing protein n=1 Tax=Plantactinospora sp. GCM10030261 TaxID=3273420 RepID=UPI003615A773